MLARREHSRAELLGKLKAKGHAETVGAQIVDELGSTGWQSEERFVTAFVNSRIGRGWGPLRILFALRERGVAGDLLESCLDGCDFEDKLLAVYTRKYGSARPESPAELAVRARFLARKGYTREQIRNLFKRPSSLS